MKDKNKETTADLAKIQYRSRSSEIYSLLHAKEMYFLDNLVLSKYCKYGVLCIIYK